MPRFKQGDFVACYITNTSVYEELLEWGMVIDTNDKVGDIMVLDSSGNTRWWPAHRWRPLSLEAKAEICNQSIILA